MPYTKWLTLLLLLTSARLPAQSDPDSTSARTQFLLYRNLYAAADSVIKTKRAGVLDSSVYGLAMSLDGVHPEAYYEKAAELLKNAKWNDAGFLLYLGYARYRYYNSVNKDYQPSGDGALLASLQATLGKPVNMYLKTYADNFIALLRKSADWYAQHDYIFCSGSKDSVKYKAQSDRLYKIAADIEKNKEKYQAEWDD